MTKRISLKHVDIALNMMGVTYDDFCNRVDMTVFDLSSQSGYDVTTIRHWIDYSEGLINEHYEDLGQ